jgi:hypothetical protein
MVGCSSAEPVSVSVQHLQNSKIKTIFTNCQKSLPFTPVIKSPRSKLQNYKQIVIFVYALGRMLTLLLYQFISLPEINYQKGSSVKISVRLISNLKKT